MLIKKILVMIFITTSVLTYCSSGDLEKSKIEKIPLLVYQQKDAVTKEAILGYWDITQSKIGYEKGMYQFPSESEHGVPLLWSGKSLTLSDEVNSLDQADKSYKLNKRDINLEKYNFSFFSDGSNGFETSFDNEFKYIISYNNQEYEIDIRNIDEFDDMFTYLANGQIIKDGKIIQLVFTASNQDNTESKVMLLNYNIDTKKSKVRSFQIDKLPGGNGTLYPGDSVLDNNKLYIFQDSKGGFIDLEKEKFIELSKINEDINSFMPEVQKNPMVPRKIVPTGKVGEILLLTDNTLYIDENTSGKLVFAYSEEEEPLGKIFIKGQTVHIFDKNNLEVSSQEFPYSGFYGHYFSFPRSY